jgi:hypothetical protein
VEEIARDQYKMVRPNEIIYIDKNKNDNKFISGIGFGGETTGNAKNPNNTDENKNKQN